MAPSLKISKDLNHDIFYLHNSLGVEYDQKHMFKMTPLVVFLQIDKMKMKPLVLLGIFDSTTNLPTDGPYRGALREVSLPIYRQVNPSF